MAASLEYAHVADAVPCRVVSLSASTFKSQWRIFVNQRCQQISTRTPSLPEENPFRWFAKMIDSKKEGSFFETDSSNIKPESLQVINNAWIL
ncbi:MAG: hypothetical protein EPN76_07705 [Burkholderiaceae bacterium]|nr:MAG: hypothetical protein EPN76_07705 [Burkholderiaceae bacterium]TAM05641.1 MAG: hypothetical protein EPN67_06430 [Pusillimonas sp.]